MSLWRPQVGPQLLAIRAKHCETLFYGGARGGGKSDYLLGDYLQDVFNYGKAWQGILFRRTMPELEQLIKRSHDIYPSTGAEWKDQAKTWTWSNGASLKLRYLERVQDASRYQGHEYVWIGWDELTQWATDEAFKMMYACLRSSTDVPVKRVRGSGNPGGPGHHWVYNRFIQPNPEGLEVISEGGHSRVFVPAKVKDNKILLEKDPDYADRLKLVGSPELVRAWLEGDWNVVTGAFFPELTVEKHVIGPCKLPDHWTRIVGYDWGSASPFGVVWAAVSDGTVPRFARDALIIYREWYGASSPGKGLKMRNEDQARGILDRESEEITYRVADPAIFAEQGGPSIAETFHLNGVAFQRGDNERRSGWGEIRSRLQGNIEGKPMIYFFSTCNETIRTLTTLQHDQKKPEDVDTTGDDHLADALRYLCKSRPFQAEIPVDPGEYRGMESITWNELIEATPRKRNSNRM